MQPQRFRPADPQRQRFHCPSGPVTSVVSTGGPATSKVPLPRLTRNLKGFDWPTHNLRGSVAPTSLQFQRSRPAGAMPLWCRCVLFADEVSSYRRNRCANGCANAGRRAAEFNVDAKRAELRWSARSALPLPLDARSAPLPQGFRGPVGSQALRAARPESSKEGTRKVATQHRKS